MSIKICVITSPFLRSRMEQALARLNLDCSFTLATYEEFSQLSALYDQYAEEMDGFLVSGQVAEEALTLGSVGHQTPVIAYQTDSAHLYKTILLHLLEEPGRDPSRILLDFMLPLGEEFTVDKFLERIDVGSLDTQVSSWMRTLRREDLLDVKHQLARQIVALWNEGKIDLVICLYNSLVPVMEELGIPYRYPHISDNELRDMICQLLVKVELDRLRSSLPTALSAAPRCRTADFTARLALLREQMDSFLQEHLLECVVQQEADSCNVFTTVEVMQYLTGRYKTSRASTWLEEHLGFPVAVGYGVGSSISEALLNARAARREAELTGHDFIRNEKGDLIGPLDTERRMVVESRNIQDAGALARRCGLSTLTIQKVAASVKLAGSNKVTSRELAQRFGVTVRNANRILTSLEAGGCARVVYCQSVGSKGRPVKVYELDLGE